MQNNGSNVPIRAIGYVRVSTEQQVEEGLSLAVQREQLRAYAKALRYELIDIAADEGLSGKNLDRPGIKKALERIEQGEARVLLITRLDRLTRSLHDLGSLIDYFEHPNRQLVSLNESINTQTASGRMMLNILGTVCQWQRETTVERVTETFVHKKHHNERLGRYMPYGVRLAADGVHLEPDADELTLIETIKRWKRRGSSYAEIADKLNAGSVPCRGARWSKMSVYFLLRPEKKTRKPKRAAAALWR